MTPGRKLQWGRSLVVAAHPDDEVLGCGGTIARLAAEGNEVHVLILGEGHTSRFTTRESADRKGIDALAASAHRAGAVLGVETVQLLGLPDNRFDGIELLDLVKIIEDELRFREVNTVLCQHVGDVNVDHRRSFEAVLAGTRPKPGTPVRNVLTFEVASSTEWAFGMLGKPFVPSCFVDVAGFVELKMAAMAAYESEVPEFPHPRSAIALRAQLTRWGATVGAEAAEAFMPVRLIY